MGAYTSRHADGTAQFFRFRQIPVRPKACRESSREPTTVGTALGLGDPWEGAAVVLFRIRPLPAGLDRCGNRGRIGRVSREFASSLTFGRIRLVSAAN